MRSGTVTLRVSSIRLARKETQMTFTLYIDDTCPKCHKPIKQAVIERHPSHVDLAIHSFHCADCGPVKAKIIELQPREVLSEAAA
jgi:hypothetical protein